MLLLPPGSPVADFAETEAGGGIGAARRPERVQGRDGGAGQVRNPEQGQVGQVCGAGGQRELQWGQNQPGIWASLLCGVNREDKQNKTAFRN